MSDLLIIVIIFFILTVMVATYANSRSINLYFAILWGIAFIAWLVSKILGQ